MSNLLLLLSSSVKSRKHPDFVCFNTVGGESALVCSHNRSIIPSHSPSFLGALLIRLTSAAVSWQCCLDADAHLIEIADMERHTGCGETSENLLPVVFDVM